MRFCNSLYVLILMACVAVPMASQSAMKGRVFAISRTGDLLPGRMAQGFLFPCERVKNVAAGEPENVCAFLLSAEHERNAPCNRYATGSTSESRCLYSAAMSSLSDTLEWAKQHRARIISFYADEEGRFTVSSVEGIFAVYVYGQAGIQDCIWQEIIKTAPSNLKLSAPLLSRPLS